jgi:hypothetical protein
MMILTSICSSCGLREKEDMVLRMERSFSLLHLPRKKDWKGENGKFFIIDKNWLVRPCM